MQSQNGCEISSLNPPFKAMAGRLRALRAAGMNAASRDIAAANASIPRPTVKVFFNIGSGRIGTLLFFVINLTPGKTVRTGSSVKVCATGKV